MTTSILILAGPVQSGKTTTLRKWIGAEKRAGGILCPDHQGLRRLMTLKDRQVHSFQLRPEEAENLPENEVESIGKFFFSSAMFELARKTLLEDAQASFPWVIIDEVGKLELANKGLEPALGQVIDWYLKPASAGTLVLVVRDYLVADVRRKYRLPPEIPEVGLSFFYSD
ncbi:MAG: hypothetical protein IPH94_19680 [Saprospiraceae bacterium]|nr:hypothetical protein [Haliscomenobacter sp.]MBK7223436.1 hypothetical protein [Saprospiraceae bacterium]MBK8878387.1 hypothetical protein [Haliscomenobacter sp.]